MAGKYMGEQKAREKAAQSIGTMKDAVDTAGKAYSAAVEGRDPKKIEAAGNVLQQQWDEYNAAREKYVIPPDMGKKGAGAKVKDAVGKMFKPQGPELYLAAAINASKQIDPRDIYGPSKREQQEGKLADLQVAGAERANAKEQQEAKDKDSYRAAIQQQQQDPSKMTPEQKSTINFYEKYYLDQSPKQRENKEKEDALKGKILDGTLPASGPEHDAAVQAGLLKPNQVMTRDIRDPKSGKPVTQLLTMSPDGTKVIATTTLPGNAWVAPDQVEEAQKVMNWKQQTYTKLLTKIHPDWKPEQVQQQVLQLVAREAGVDWSTQSEQMEAMNSALVELQHNHTHTSTVGGQKVQQQDELGQFIGNYFVTDADGRYAWNPRLAGDQGHTGWFGTGDPTYGGHTVAEIKQKENQALAELRAIVKKQHPKWQEWQIDQVMPKSGPQQQSGQPGPQAGGMQPSPGQPGQEAPPNLGEGNTFQPGTYTATAPDGSVIASDLSQSQKEFMEKDPKGKGLKFTLNSDSNMYAPGMVP
jgi:hypothetical protein